MLAAPLALSLLLLSIANANGIPDSYRRIFRDTVETGTCIALGGGAISCVHTLERTRKEGVERFVYLEVNLRKTENSIIPEDVRAAVLIFHGILGDYVEGPLAGLPVQDQERIIVTVTPENQWIAHHERTELYTSDDAAAPRNKIMITDVPAPGGLRYCGTRRTDMELSASSVHDLMEKVRAQLRP